MLKKSYCKLIWFLGLCSLVGILSGCQKNPNSNGIPPSEDQFQDISDITIPSQKTIQVQETINQWSTSQETISQSTTPSTKLQISSRCVGCERCVRIDPSHFASAGHHSKAYVVSQENLNSDTVQEAIDSCPTSAISLA